VAVKALVNAPQVAMTCIDAGHPGWVSAGDMDPYVDMLDKVGADDTGCISLNVSNAYSDQANVDYVKAINARSGLPPLAALVDTSRNGGDTPPDGKWCNVPGRKLGRAPTTQTGVPEVFAYAYIKRPGQSDGDGEGCNPGDLPAGKFDMRQAVSLARDEID
jgi:endoglucanase